MSLRPADHDWTRPFPTKDTTWVCSRCQCVRISKVQPPAHMLVVLPKPFSQKRGVSGPAPGEKGLTCADVYVQHVQES